jgi:hypothetical protein
MERRVACNSAGWVERSDNHRRGITGNSAQFRRFSLGRHTIDECRMGRRVSLRSTHRAGVLFDPAMMGVAALDPSCELFCGPDFACPSHRDEHA